jgi:hypothetical protein
MNSRFHLNLKIFSNLVLSNKNNMDIQAEKLKLVQAVLNIEDIDLIKEVEDLLTSRNHDWFDDLSEEQQHSVLTGLEQLDRGEGIPHNEAVARLGL